jgi:type I restriction enzyme S subunit
MVNIGQGTILEMSIVIPTWAEQQQILAFILSECGKLDKLSQEGESAVSLLRERRSALISAAVTGQIDVRNAA